MDALLDFLVTTLMTEYKEETALLLLLALAGAIISWALTEPIMAAIFADEEKTQRWKPVGFFIVDTLFLLLLGYNGIVNGTVDWYRFLASIMFISSLSAVIYAAWPKVLQKLGSAATRYNRGGAVDKKLNGNKDKE